MSTPVSCIELERYLEDLENRIHPEDELRIMEGWLDWADHKNTGGFKPASRAKSVSTLEWPHVNINDTLADDDLALYRELEGIHYHLTRGDNSILRVRANFGVGNIATAFGAPLYMMPRETDTLPNVRSIGEAAIRAIPERPLPTMEDGNLSAVFRIGRRLKEIVRFYPKLGGALRIEQPDLQGPMDNLELLYGSGIFYLLYDEPELVHAMLSRITDFMEFVMDSWLDLFPNEGRIASYFRHVERGAIAVRDDSAMNLSPEFYEAFLAPYDGRLLNKYGGIVHFCGRGDHYINKLASLKGLKGINMSQPHLNDMEKIFDATIDRGIHLSISAPAFPVREHDTSNLIFLD